MAERPRFAPKWTEHPPPALSYRSIFKWGAPDGFKHPNPRLYAMLKERLGMTDEDFKAKRNVGEEQVREQRPVRLSSEQIGRLTDFVGRENAATDDYSRLKYSTGKTSEEALELRLGVPVEVTDLALYPRDKGDVRKIVEYCHAERIPIYVFGGGSSVNFGFAPVKGGVTLVMSAHMNRVLEFNETNQTATVESGIMGPDYESALNRAPEGFGATRRYTCGHFPQSFEYSSVGGWIVTLGSGQQSSYYGDIYDIVIAQEYVTPTGSFKTLEYPATATGPKVNDIMKGSEGAFGVLVSATLKVFRHMPENTKRFAFVFPDWEAAVSASREISVGEFGMPSVFRISDPEETEVALKLYGVDGTILDRIITMRGFKPMRRCLFIGQADGHLDYTTVVKRNVKRVCKSFGAMYISGYPLKSWEHGRYSDPYMREDLNDFGVVIDTLECSVKWDNLHQVHERVRSYVKSRPHTICMTHCSHFYPQGTNLYFIFMGRMSDAGEFRKFHRGIIDAIEAAGGSLSHHHGIGKMMAPWMERHLGSTQMNVLRGLKRSFDPHNIMNPGGTLGLDSDPEEGKP